MPECDIRMSRDMCSVQLIFNEMRAFEENIKRLRLNKRYFKEGAFEAYVNLFLFCERKELYKGEVRMEVAASAERSGGCYRG